MHGSSWLACIYFVRASFARLEEKTFFLRNWRSVLFIYLFFKKKYENPERKIFDKKDRKLRKISFEKDTCMYVGACTSKEIGSSYVNSSEHYLRKLQRPSPQISKNT